MQGSLCRAENRQSRTVELFVFVMMLMLCVRDIGGLAIPKVVFIVACGIFFLAARSENLTSMMAFLMPLLWGLPRTYVLLAWVVVYFAKDRKVNRHVLILGMLFFSLEIVAALFYPTMDLVSIVTYSLTLIVFFSFSFSEKNSEYSSIIRYFFLGTVFLCFVIMVLTLRMAPSNWVELFTKGWFRFGVTKEIETEMKLSVNANTLAYYSVMGIALGYVILMDTKGKLKRVAVMVGTATCLGAGLFTVSRSWMLIMVLLVLMILFDCWKSTKGVVVTAVSLAAVAVVLMIIFQKNTFIQTAFLTRFSHETMSTGGGRIEFIKLYNEILFSNPRYMILGTGVTQYRELLQMQSVHNAVQQIFVCLGIPCGMVYVGGVILSLRGVKKQRFVFWIPLITAVLFLQTIQILNPYALMLPVSIGIITVKNGTKKARAQNEAAG